jgi:hypothetical protein
MRLSPSTNRELNHRECYDGSSENGEDQPSGDALIAIPQLPNVRGKARRCSDSARVCFQSGVKRPYFRRFCHLLGNSIRIIECHGRDITTGNLSGDARERPRGLTAIVVSRK